MPGLRTSWTEPHNGDDKRFLAIVNRIVERLTMDNDADVRVVRIDNWFGPKWLGFAGKRLGVLSVHGNTNRSGLVVPPFTPSRVVRENHFSKSDGHYSRLPSPSHLHRKQTSAANLRRKLVFFSPHAHFIWFSGNSQRNGRAGMLVASVCFAEQDAFYLGFTLKANVWRVGDVAGRPSFPPEEPLTREPA